MRSRAELESVERSGVPATGRPEALRVWLLGGFRVSVGARTIEARSWRLSKAASLVKLLAIAPGHRLHRERVTDLLWPELNARAASNNLRGALHAARRTLGPSTARRHLEVQDEQLVLFPTGQLWVDVEAFEDAAATARRSREPATYRVAVELYAGELLPEDRLEGWSQGRRDALRQLYLALLIELAAAHEEREEYEMGIEVLLRTVSEEPAREEAHAALMRLYTVAGRRQEAILQYERLREVLSRELDARPSAQSRLLHEEIRAGSFPPVRSPDDGGPSGRPAGSARHNLPASPTSFVGRGQEMLEVRRLLPTTRLLTLTGAGGSGKTRLALEIARDLAGAYPDGAWLVELAGLSEPQLVPQAVASSLGVREQPGRPLLDTIIRALRDRELLLVVDNCEHLIGASARLLQALLSSCPRLKVLATSREPLGLQGEVVCQVPPLALPATTNGASTVEDLVRYEAIRLFVDRARLRLPDFELTRENAGPATRVCRKLDGIPLAIELATATMGSLTVEQLAQRLDDSLALLTGGGRSAEPKQQTLRATLDWSHELLTEPEKRLFARLSVFAGGWTLEAAETVGAGGAITGGDVLDLLSRLADKSLVVAEPRGDGGARYRLLEPVRQYARERLEGYGQLEETRRRHAGWHLALVEETEKESSGPGHGAWARRLETEHDNLRAALGWSLEGGDAEVGLRLAGALWLFWFTRGYLFEGRGWLEKGASEGRSAAAKAKALNGAGWIAIFQEDLEAAEALVEESLALYRELEDEEGIASCLNYLGFVALLGGREDMPVAALLREALTLKPRIRDRRTIANTLVFAALEALLLRQDWDETVALHEEALSMFREVEDTWGISICLINLGLILVAMQQYVRGTALLRELMRLSQETGDKFTNQYAFFGLACVADSGGQPLRAARLWGVSEAIREAAGIQLPSATVLVMRYESRLTETRARLGEAAFEEAWAEGKAIPPEEAVAYALSEEADVSATPATQKPPPGEPTDELTRREQEVAVLVARGLTNRQISNKLEISERTAGNHVGRILRKLGLHSRAQIAGWATEYRLLEPHPD